MSKCEHGRKESICVMCRGSEICEHLKRKSRCVECMGSQICIHKKLKSRCITCGGSEICVHKKIKSYCVSCKGSQVCEHRKRKNICKLCDGNDICQHGIQKFVCKNCMGASICIHNNRKSYCKICKGSQICQHSIIIHNCKICKGSQVCIHEKYKSRCKICGGSALCKSSWCETVAMNPKYEGYCMPCFVNNPENIDKPIIKNYKTKEKDVIDRIKETFPDFTWVSDKRVADGCSRRRPDLLLDMGSHIIIVEIDENKHTSYDCSCENKRLMELSQDLQHRPIVFIRFNPDDYTNEEGTVIKSCWRLNKLGVMQIMKTKQKEWEERILSLKQQIEYWINNPTEKTIETIELFY